MTVADEITRVISWHRIGAYNGTQTACGGCGQWMTDAEYRQHLVTAVMAVIDAERTHPDGKISPTEQAAMDQYPDRDETVCWNCSASSQSFVLEPDPGMMGMTDRVRCLSCNEAQELSPSEQAAMDQHPIGDKS